MAQATLSSYVYAEPGYEAKSGVAAPASAPFQGVHTIGIREQGTPAITTWARLSVPTRADFGNSTDPTSINYVWTHSLLLAYPGGPPSGDPYQFVVSYNPAVVGYQLQISNLLGHNFIPVFPNQSAASFTGFTQWLSMTGWNYSWTGASPTLGFMNLVGATVHPPEEMSKVTMNRYRHGRSFPVGWQASTVHRCTIWIRKVQAGALMAGYCLTGRVRLDQDYGGSGVPYGPTALNGYVDGYVVNCTNLRAYGASEDFLQMDLTIAVPR